jgi:hypothetical protein
MDHSLRRELLAAYSHLETAIADVRDLAPDAPPWERAALNDILSDALERLRVAICSADDDTENF